MASSSMPHEIVTWYLLPAVRREMAKSMLKAGMSQREAARRMGLTDAAVSQYLSGKRGSDIRLEPSVRKLVSGASARIARGADVMAEIDAICGYCTDNLVLCRLHKAHGAPRKCDICFKRVK